MGINEGQKQQPTGQFGLSKEPPEDETKDNEDMSNYHRIRVRVTPQGFGVKIYQRKSNGWDEIVIGSAKLVSNVFALPIY